MDAGEIDPFLDEIIEQLQIEARKNQVASKARKAKDEDLDTVDLDEI
jgi:hypothetical protein